MRIQPPPLREPLINPMPHIWQAWLSDLADGVNYTINPSNTDHALLDNLDSANYTHLTATQKTDLTDGGNTVLHSHAQLHDAATVLDSTSIDLAISGQQISAAAIFGDDNGTVCEGDDSRLSDARIASDVYAWAKESTKPAYTYSEVGADASGAAATVQGNLNTHAGLTTTAHGLGGSAFHPDGFYQNTIKNTYLVSSYASLTAAISAIGATVCTLIIDADTAITSNSTIPATMSIFWIANKKISGEFTLAINGKFVNYPKWQIFPTTGVSFGVDAISYVMPEWWGAKADDSTHCTVAIQAAEDAYIGPGRAKSIHFSAGTYRLTDSIWVDITHSYTQRIGDFWGTVIKQTGANKYCWLMDNADKFRFENIKFDGHNRVAAGAIWSWRSGYGRIGNCWTEYFNDVNFYFEDTLGMTFEDCYLLGPEIDNGTYLGTPLRGTCYRRGIGDPDDPDFLENQTEIVPGAGSIGIAITAPSTSTLIKNCYIGCFGIGYHGGYAVRTGSQTVQSVNLVGNVIEACNYTIYNFSSQYGFSDNGSYIDAYTRSIIASSTLLKYEPSVHYKNDLIDYSARGGLDSLRRYQSIEVLPDQTHVFTAKTKNDFWSMRHGYIKQYPEGIIEQIAQSRASMYLEYDLRCAPTYNFAIPFTGINYDEHLEMRTVIAVGTAVTTSAFHLYNDDALFKSSMVGMIVRNLDRYNSSAVRTATITAVNSSYDVTLDADIMLEGDDYEVYHIPSRYVQFAGTCTAGTTGTTLEDTTKDFSAKYASVTHALNTTTWTATRIVSAGADNTKIVLEDSGLFALGDKYELVKLGQIMSGKATSTSAGKLIDANATFPAGIDECWIHNLSKNTFARIGTVNSDTELGTVDPDIMSAGDYYEIYNCKFTAERAGYYMVSLASAFTGLSRGCAIRAYVMKNNNYVYFLEDARHTLYNDDATCGIQRQIYLAAGDWIQFRTRQDSGLPQTVYGGERWTSVQIHKMS